MPKKITMKREGHEATIYVNGKKYLCVRGENGLVMPLQELIYEVQRLKEENQSLRSLIRESDLVKDAVEAIKPILESMDNNENSN